jgi:phosphoglycerol transferase MdoB-like AlkP superfamily enzyme
MYNVLNSLTTTCKFLLLFLVFRLGLLYIYPENFSNLTIIQCLSALIEGMRFDLSITLTFIGIPLLFLALPFKFAAHKNWRTIFNIPIFIVFFGFLLLSIADLLYFAHVNRHIGSELLPILQDNTFIITYTLQTQKLKLFFFIATITGIGFIWFKNSRKNINYTPNILLNITSFILFVFIAIVAFRGVTSSKPLHIVDAYKNGNFAYGNLVLNGVFSSFHLNRNGAQEKYAFYAPNQLNDNVTKHVNKYNTNNPFKKIYANNIPSKYNIFVLLLESWDLKYINSFNHANPVITPNFDYIANNGIKFTNFYASGQRSIEGIQSTLSSIPYLNNNPPLGQGLEQANITKLGEICSSLGYQTIFSQSSKYRSYRIGPIANAMGFKQVYGKEDIPLLLNYPKDSVSEFGWDYETFMHNLSTISGDKPFISYIFTGTTHAPYPSLPAQFMQYPHDPDNQTGFLNTLIYSDWALGEFFKHARQQPWFDNTVFILTADHRKNTDRHNNFKNYFHIPFVIYAPKIFPARVENRIFSHLDVMPTILDLIGYNQEFTSFGESIFRKKEQFAFLASGSNIGAITEQGWMQHSTKSILDSTGLNNNDAQQLEEKLLTLIQVTSELLDKNVWE